MSANDLDEALTPPAPQPSRRRFRLSRLEVVAAAVAALAMAVLVVLEPDILEAPFENWRTLLLTFGGTALAGLALVTMVGFGVPSMARVLVLGVPFVIVSWWLISPFFIDDVVEDPFESSIAAQVASTTASPTTAASALPGAATSAPAVPTTASTAATAPAITPPTTNVPPTTVPTGPVLLGAGTFIGLAGHDGTGDAGIFRVDTGHVLRLENLDIDNGPDLRLYVLPGAAQVAPGDGAVYLGPLRGNVGNLNYDLPADFTPTSGDWTVLVWCEAFDVEFVGATLSIA